MKKRYIDEDYIGKTFGRLTVISVADKPDYWVCECKCGTIKEIKKYGIINGSVLSCGCLKKEKVSERNKKVIPEGTRFGNLTVKNIYNGTDKDGIWYNCECDCGVETVVKGTYLRAGKIKSCGKCVQNTMVGKKFGRLTVLSEHHRDNKKIYYDCECECGNHTIVEASKLRSGWTKSCGCLSIEKLIERSKKYNKYDLTGEYGIGYGSGGSFKFDKEDYDIIKDSCWYINNDGYVVNSYDEYLHRIIMNALKDMEVDHINHDPTDCRKNNLRICEHYNNLANTKLYKTNTSGFKNVYYNKSNDKWYVSIIRKGEEYRSRDFDDKTDAIKYAYNLDKKLRGEYSYYNSMGLNYEQ